MFSLTENVKQYVASFNAADDETVCNLVPNAHAAKFLCEQVPLVELPDKELERIYYFRWWTYRKHLKHTEDGYVLTEFLPPVSWSGKHNTINCPACLHTREGRWLKDKTITKDYLSFWLNRVGNTMLYSSWYAHAVWEYCTLTGDFDFAIERLDDLITLFCEREAKRLCTCGLYWSHDGYDGMEKSISGWGLRPTVNSYAYGDAVAIAKIAALAGRTDVQTEFEQKAAAIKNAVDRLLWDKDFYKVIPAEETENPDLTERPIVPEAHNVREELGYIPWYFMLPDEGREACFARLFDDMGFAAPYGITSAERAHPRFMEPHSHECLWNGPVWPFATSQTLVAFANVLRHYAQDTVDKNGYYTLLKQYADSHRLEREDGTVVPWIDENMHPFTGRWLARDILHAYGKPERGMHYNHSLFCDLILSGLLGIDNQNGTLTLNPLIPDEWTYFRIENLYVGGKSYAVYYDKDGTHYGKGIGLTIETR